MLRYVLVFLLLFIGGSLIKILGFYITDVLIDKDPKMSQNWKLVVIVAFIFSAVFTYVLATNRVLG